MKQLLLLICLFFSLFIFSQKEIEFTSEDFTLRGDAVFTGSNCFKLTDPEVWMGGTVWYKSPIDLNQPFEMEMDIKLGCDDNGADGIVFLFHDRLRTGRQGEGMGFGGLVPSLGIEMDTYQNFHLEDPHFDHLALMKNGRMHHRSGLTAPIPIFSNKKNIEDCAAHQFKVRWLAESKILQVFIDGTLRINKRYDLVKNVFRNNPNVYWGFSAATGGSFNLHQVCLEKLQFAKVSIFDLPTQKKLLEGKPYDLKNVDFLSGKVKLEKTAYEELDKLATLLNSQPHLEIYINGHTDSSGDAYQNKLLSKKRADIVKKYLIDEGIKSKRIHSSGSGEAFPKASNTTSSGRKINRRIEILLIDPRA